MQNIRTSAQTLNVTTNPRACVVLSAMTIAAAAVILSWGKVYTYAMLVYVTLIN